MDENFMNVTVQNILFFQVNAVETAIEKTLVDFHSHP